MTAGKAGQGRAGLNSLLFIAKKINRKIYIGDCFETKVVVCTQNFSNTPRKTSLFLVHCHVNILLTHFAPVLLVVYPSPALLVCDPVLICAALGRLHWSLWK